MEKYWDNKNNCRMFDLATINNNNVLFMVEVLINIRGHRMDLKKLNPLF